MTQVIDPSEPVQETEDAPDQTVLVVDLDGTLSRTDTLHEALLRLVASEPRRILEIPGWLRGGRARFKTRVADHMVVPADAIPINQDVVERVRAARAEGRRTALVSASDTRQVRAVADALDLFDDVHGSDADHNLKGENKRAFLMERYAAGFDYIGDAAADIPVWKAARKAFVVGEAPGFSARMKTEVPDAEFLPGAGSWNSLLKAIRPHQWSKNALIFLPLAAAHDVGAIGAAILAFMAFCLTASSAYLLNDLLDLEADRSHPRKSKRPFAAGNLSIANGVMAIAALILAAAVLGALTASPLFCGVLLGYLVLTLLYSLWLKRKPIIDVMMLGGLYTTRIIAGAAATAIALSPWMLGFSIFVFLSLAAVKRQAELVDALKEGREIAGRGYVHDDLPILQGIALSAGTGAVLVFALYISSPDVQALYSDPQYLWGICPPLLYWLYRMVMKAHRSEMTDDPIVFAATDRISLGIAFACAVILITASI